MKDWEEIRRKVEYLRRLQTKLIKEHDLVNAQRVEAEIKALNWVLDLS